MTGRRCASAERVPFLETAFSFGSRGSGSACYSPDPARNTSSIGGSIMAVQGMEHFTVLAESEERV